MRLDVATLATIPLPRHELDRRLDEAEAYLTLRLPDRALEILRARAEWPHREFRAALLKGRLYKAQGRLDDAMRQFERAAARNPDDPRLALNVAWCYRRTHRLAQAIDILERIKTLAQAAGHPRAHPLVHYNLACYWTLAGHQRRALRELRDALRQRPNLRHRLPAESDLHPLRQDPEYQALLHGFID